MCTADLDRHLEELVRATNEVIAELEGKVDDAVNWGDLTCIDAWLCLGRGGDRWYAVCITEADPCATRFQECVRQKLAERGYENVEVYTEW